MRRCLQILMARFSTVWPNKGLTVKFSVLPLTPLSPLGRGGRVTVNMHTVGVGCHEGGDLCSPFWCLLFCDPIMKLVKGQGGEGVYRS